MGEENKNSMENRQVFVNLFYAVIIGAACSKIDFPFLLPTIFFQLLLLFVILEDWYGFYKKVCPEIKEYEYTGCSLFFESAILLSWYCAFVSLSNQLIYGCSFSLFYILKLLAGVRAYHGNPKKIKNDYFFLIPAASSLVFLFPSVSMVWKCIIQAACVFLCVHLWWKKTDKK